jgi:hypothetical protein
MHLQKSNSIISTCRSPTFLGRNIGPAAPTQAKSSVSLFVTYLVETHGDQMRNTHRHHDAAIDATEGRSHKERSANHLANSRAAIAAGTDNAQHRRHAGLSDGGKKGAGVPTKTCRNARGVSRPLQSRARAPAVCSYRKKNNNLSAHEICFDPNCAIRASVTSR